MLPSKFGNLCKNNTTNSNHRKKVKLSLNNDEINTKTNFYRNFQDLTSRNSSKGQNKNIDSKNDALENASHLETKSVFQKSHINVPFQQVRDYFIFGPLGSGSYSTVKKAIHKDNTAKIYAMKIIEVEELHQKLIQKFVKQDDIDVQIYHLMQNEVRIFQKFENYKLANPKDKSCQYIIGLKEIFQEPKMTYIILDLAEKGYFLSDEFWKHIFKRRAKNTKRNDTDTPVIIKKSTSTNYKPTETWILNTFLQKSQSSQNDDVKKKVLT